MTQTPENTRFTDADLLAYLNGELDTETHAQIEAALEEDRDLEARLLRLDPLAPPLEQASDALAAVTPSSDDLEPLLDSAVETVDLEHRGSISPEWWLMAASIIIAFALGVFIDEIIREETGPVITAERPVPPPSVSEPTPEPAKPEPAPAKRGWKKAVADYAELYGRSTFVNEEPSEAQIASDLAHVERELGLPLPQSDLTVEGYRLARAEILNFNGMPLAQIAYLGESGEPILLCIIKSPKAATEKPPAPAAINDLNLIGWDKDGFGYVVIGKTEPDQIKALSDVLYSRLI